MTFDTLVFGFVMEPRKLLDNDGRTRWALEGPERAELDAAIKRMEENRQGVIVGQDRLKKLEEQIGDRITLYGRNFKDINLEVEIVGTFPSRTVRYVRGLQSRILQCRDGCVPRITCRETHPLADKTLNLVWLKLSDKPTFDKVAQQIVHSASFTQPSVKFETSSSGIATFLESYRDLIWGMRWLLAPACMGTLSLVIANAISISVREQRQTEFAVMKVLGFRPLQILTLVLLEALFVGDDGRPVECRIDAWFHQLDGGPAVSDRLLPEVPDSAELPVVGSRDGSGTALAGSVLPALSAQSVKVANVFAKVT